MHVSRRDILTGLAICPMMAGMPSIARAMAPPASPKNSSRKPLFGIAVRPDQLFSGSDLEAAIRRDCQLIVPEYHGQWSAVEWVRGESYHGNYDAITGYARATGKMVRGHALLWDQMTPQWAKDEMAADADWSLIRNHFADLLPRYRGAIGEWVVVNEMIDTENGASGIRRNAFQRAFGNDYIARALETAHSLDPEAKLMINDYSLVQDNPVDAARRLMMLKLVEELKARGTPLHAVGVQGHIELAKGPIAQDEVRAFLAELADFGVDVAITELDVLESDRGASIEARDRHVAEATERLLDVACAERALTSVTTWGVSDRLSWLQEREPPTREAQACSPVDCAGLNRGLPYDGAMQAKPMREVLGRYVA